ncbi:hypothetical protein [Salinivibrio sp. KP-1]|uniref:hypothetical protein n=1 Tax=Salinivibrio sp. KP-1 TaxID=1406902 RepID=UPI0006148A51|nr:hypothetical protein [Salinivibrio sp. KP-1]KKA43440.1 hypothetical protein WN56_13715 [Salinivibrio sp. KP-1]
MSKALEYMETAMGKANELRYFVALSTFTLMLDAVLVYTQNTSILAVNWDYLTSSVTQGSALVFLCCFSLFMVFVIPPLMSFIRFIAIETGASSFFDKLIVHREEKRSYLYPISLSQYALKNNNEVAYKMALEQTAENHEALRMEKYSFAFLLVSVCSLLVSTESTPTIMGLATDVDLSAGLFSSDNAKLLIMYIVYPSLFWIGVLRGCGFVINHANRRIYAPDIYNEVHPKPKTYLDS